MDDRVIAEIDLNAIRNNLLAIKNDLKKNVKIMSILKANAYGHGAVQVAKYTEDIIDYIAVATIQEGVNLRKHGIAKPILVLGETVPSKLLIARKYNILTTVFSNDIMDRFIAFAKKNSIVAKIHLKIDTGMNRIGIRFDDFDTIYKIFTCPYLKVEGIFSHLADSENEIFTSYQVENFKKVLNFLNENNFSIPLCHIANSAGCKNSNNYFDCVRIGIAQYIPEYAYLNPAMTLKAKIVQIKEVGEGEAVGYDCSYTPLGRIRVATIAIGYADGLMRSLSNKGKVLVNGAIADIIGKICMDFTMIDITNIANVNVGDYVTIFGKDKITAKNVASISGTISYEVITHLSDRVKRVYKP